MLANFDSDNFITNVSGGHQAANAEKDMQLILRQLQTVFKEMPGRMHTSFKNPRDPLHFKSVNEIKDFIKTHLKL